MDILTWEEYGKGRRETSSHCHLAGSREGTYLVMAPVLHNISPEIHTATVFLTKLVKI